MVFVECVKIVTALCSFITAYIIFSDKRISSHPGSLIGIICLF